MSSEETSFISPLAGLRVLGVTVYLAGPFTLVNLARLGAEAIKVEVPEYGDPTRGNGPFADPDGYSPTKETDSQLSTRFLKRSQGVKSVTLNLKHPEGKQMFLDMAAKSDVVVENLSPGAMRRLGLGYEDVLKVNPKIIYASISGYGQTGPHSHRKAHDPEIQGMSGIMDINGDPDGPPMRVGFYIADLVTPIFTCYSILAALRNRDITGKGQYLDVSMMDTLTSLMFVENIEEALYAGEPLRMGNGIRGGPMGLYHTKDGDIIITVASDDQWERLAKAIGAPHLIEDPRFARFLDRGKNLDAARSSVQEILMTFTKKEALKILDQNDVPCSDVRSVSQIIDDQHFWDRGTLRSMRSQAFDEDLPGIVSGFPVVFSGGSLPQETGAPLLGQQNADIYGDILGIDESHLSRLESDGVI
ncbi:MAG: CoA transferase [Chloroflexota bacterium]|nr:CoA transferase [Chloroflexota bacterium]MED5429126.1 CoA transferase [Chloroflexota bacterium]